ncbi:MAG: hypothetical protein AAF409_13755 [Pseudomonadota bacterium]
MRALLVLVFLWPLATMAQEGMQPDDARIEIRFEKRTHLPYPGELVLLSIHGTYKVPVVREKLVEPDLAGFDWMQLGEDRWYKAREDGFEVLKFERRMALYPQEAGILRVAAFTHQLELLSRTSETVPVSAISNEAEIEVAPPLDGVDWWFPVNGIEINDGWSNQPEALPAGGSALRVITLTVLGTLPQRIPPMPEMTGAGVHIFPHPEHRIVALGPDGPVTRVFWRWTVRPKAGSAGYLNPIRMAYFDTGMRDREEVVFAAQRIAHAGGPETVLAEGASPDLPPVAPETGVTETQTIPGWAVPATAGGGLLLGLAGIIIGLWHGGTWHWPKRWHPDPARLALRRAVRRRDAGAVRHAGHALCARAGAAVPEALAALDQSLYGQTDVQPGLSHVARAVREAVRGAI